MQKENFADIKIGISNANEREKKAVEDVYQLLRGAKVDCVAAEDIEAEIWRKYIFNCAYNVLTAHYRQNVGELRADAKKREEFRRLLQEAYEVGKAKGVHLEEEDIVRHQNRFENKLADDATSSLQRDVEDGKHNTELETFCAVEDVYQLLRGAKVDCVAAEDIEAEIWRKYIFNCAYNVLTAHYRQNVGELRADAKKREEFRRLLQEAYEVGKAKGVHLEEEDIVRHQNRFENKLADDATSSLQRDVEDGKHNTELETFCGYIVRVGRELGVDVSLTEKFYRMDS